MMMTMEKEDKEMFVGVLTALNITHGLHSTSNEREKAYHYLEEFKVNPKAASWALHVLSSESVVGVLPDFARHFALQLLYEFVKNQWNGLAVEAQLDLRSHMINLLIHPETIQLKSIVEEPVYVKGKLAMIINEIAKRQFPQRWPDFLDLSLRLLQSGSDIQKEIVLMILRSLAEDAVNCSFNAALPPDRRSEILQGLNVCMPQICPILYTNLDWQYQRYKAGAVENRRSLPMQESLDRKASRMLLVAMFQMLKEFVDWMPFANLFAAEGNFVWVCTLVLEDPELACSAVECLTVIANRTYEKEHADLLPPVLRGWIQTVQRLSMSNFADADALRFHHKLNSMLVEFGIKQVDTLMQLTTLNPTCTTTQAQTFASTNTNSSTCSTSTTGTTITSVQVTELIQEYVRLMLSLFQHPSLVICEAQLNLWIAWCKHSTMKKQAYFQAIFPELWAVLFEKYFKFGAPSKENSLTSQCSFHEFDDDDAFHQFMGNCRGKLVSLLHQLNLSAPHLGLQLLVDKFSCLSENKQGRDYLSSKGWCTEESTAFLLVEGYTAFLDALLRHLPSHVFQLEATQSVLRRLVIQLLQYDPVDPLLLYRQLQSLASFAPYYAMDAEALSHVLNKLFANVTFLLPGESLHSSTNPLSNVTILARRRAISSLVALCKAIPKTLLPSFQELCSQVIRLFQEDLVLGPESVMLYEMLVLVSNSMPEAQQQIQFLEEIIREPVAMWTSPDMTALIASPEAIVQSIESNRHGHENGHAHDQGAPQASEEGHVKNVRLSSINKVLSTMYGIAKRVHRSSPPSSSFNVSSLEDSSASSTLPTAAASPSSPSCSLNPFLHIWPHILTNLCQVMHTLHRFWSFSIKQQVYAHPQACWLLAITYEELIPLLGGGGGGMDSIEEWSSPSDVNEVSKRSGPPSCSFTSSPLRPHVPKGMHWAKWQKGARDYAYHLLGAALSQPDLYALTQLKDSLLHGLLADIQDMEHRHVRNLIAFTLLPMIRGCPPAAYASVLHPILHAFFAHVSQRLNEAWSDFIQATTATAAATLTSRTTTTTSSNLASNDLQSSTSSSSSREPFQKVEKSTTTTCSSFSIQANDSTRWFPLVLGIEEDAKQEVIQAKILVDLTRSVFDVMELMYDAKTVVGVHRDAKHVMLESDRQLRDFLLRECPAITQMVLLMLMQTFRWRDTVSCRLAVTLADKLVNVLATMDAKDTATPPTPTTIPTLSSSSSSSSCSWSPLTSPYAELLGKHLFHTACLAIIQNVDHIQQENTKWDIMHLIQNIYTRFVLGLVPVDECKGIDPLNQPYKAERELCFFPYECLQSLMIQFNPLYSSSSSSSSSPSSSCNVLLILDEFHTQLRQNPGLKARKNLFKEFFELHLQTTSLDQQKMRMAISTASQACHIESLPEKLVLSTKKGMETLAATSLQDPVIHYDTTNLFQ